MIYTGTYQTRFKMPILPNASVLYSTAVAGELTFVDIICVKVEGKSYDIIYSGTPSNRTVLYRQNFGSLMFDRNLGNKSIYVIYQH